ncbi:MAG: hypothetical protein CMG19_04895 [Candidatus Marinimicrobia bacterium]|nr:hypothetical protein [Candidatus Neomarinimicrobiota bacterium]|tara:strand:+ start:5520 stop:6494 length:975 start_codon:yes stop_codon:yes gene_type:complete
MIIRHPSAYHGRKNKRPFFEGWYHKLTTISKKSLAIIPGIYHSGISDNKTAFIMIFEGNNGNVFFERFGATEFECSKSEYNLQIGPNFFSLNEMKLDISTNNLQLKGKVNTKHLKPWPVTLFEPGCMGMYAYIPTMECFHGILSMDHSLNGKLELNESVYDFSDGRGYIEKDWGKNFPEDWIWAQANHFENNHASISASLATIPWKRMKFAGFIVGLYFDNKFYRFTTYRNTIIKDIYFDSKKFYWLLQRKDLSLHLTIERGKKDGLLFAPDKNDMIPKVIENLDGKIRCQLYHNDSKIFDDYSNLCATEFIGNTKQLIKMTLN